MSVIKSFRGLIADAAQDTIALHTNNGSTGYRIVKFQLMPEKPGGADNESSVKIYKVEQTISSIDAVVDFNDPTLIAVATISNQTSQRFYPVTSEVIFDNEIFNQDIYVTHEDQNGSAAVNYYIELEQIKLDLAENTLATLKDIRNIEGGLFPTP